MAIKKRSRFIIEREIPFKQGEYLSPKDLEKQLVVANSNWSTRAFFGRVGVHTKQIRRACFYYRVCKRAMVPVPLPYFKLADRNINTWWVTYNHSFQRVNYGVKFLHNQYSGRNDKFTAWLFTGYPGNLP
jgi:hypothetical protein